jgi:hypothetical protein
MVQIKRGLGLPAEAAMQGRKHKSLADNARPRRHKSLTPAGGTEAAFVFRWVFLAALVFLALSLTFQALMEEQPLRQRHGTARSAG